MIELTNANILYSKYKQIQRSIADTDYISFKINTLNMFYKDRKKLRIFLT